MKIYTRTGDDGTTSLAGGRRVPKFHTRVEAYGSLDELISWIGLLRSCPVNVSRDKILIYIQNQLMICAAILSAEAEDLKSRGLKPDPKCALRLESEIDIMEKKLPVLRNFILPGGNIFVSYCDIARCVCRRAERNMLKLNQTEKIPLIICKFLNRLSDYLFMLSRQISLDLDNKVITWPK